MSITDTAAIDWEYACPCRVASVSCLQIEDLEEDILPKETEEACSHKVQVASILDCHTTVRAYRKSQGMAPMGRSLHHPDRKEVDIHLFSTLRKGAS